MSTVFYVSYGALWLLVLVLGGLLLLLYRHFGMMSLGTLEGVQRDGLPVGAEAPPISGITATGADDGWDPGRGRPELVVFASPDCEPCKTVLPAVNRLATAAGNRLGVTAIVPGPQESVERLVAQYDPPYLCIAEDGSGAFNRFRVRVTPFAFVIGKDGRVLAKGLCNDPVRLRELLAAGGLEAESRMIGAPGQPLNLVRREVGAAVAGGGGDGRSGGGLGAGRGSRNGHGHGNGNGTDRPSR